MHSITLQVSLYIAAHAQQYCVGDAFWSHNQNKGHMFEDDENKATIVAQSKQRVKLKYNGSTSHWSVKWIWCNSPTVSYLQTLSQGIIWLIANDAKVYLGILWHGCHYRKSEIMDFVKTVN